MDHVHRINVDQQIIGIISWVFLRLFSFFMYLTSGAKGHPIGFTAIWFVAYCVFICTAYSVNAVFEEHHIKNAAYCRSSMLFQSEFCLCATFGNYWTVLQAVLVRLSSLMPTGRRCMFCLLLLHMGNQKFSKNVFAHFAFLFFWEVCHFFVSLSFNLV